MCGPFSRDLTNAPKSLLDQIQQQQAAFAKQQLPAVSLSNFDLGFNTEEASPLDADIPFGLPQVFSKSDDIQNLPVPDVDDSSIFNWNILDEPFAAPSAAAPSAASTPEDFGFPQEFDFDFSLNAPSVVKAEPAAEAAAPERKAPVTKKQSARASSKAKPPKPPAAAPPKSDSDDAEIGEGECKPYTEKLPKDLLDHPCAATLLSAGIRIKGRTREELLEVAERIKKRRRASAARCRARKATHVHHLEDENKELKQENIMLKQRIAELTGGTMNMDDFFSNNVPPMMQQQQAMNASYAF